LSQFSRRAKWLGDLFSASVLPRADDPGVVSDDVSLVQSYDGGGHGFEKFFRSVLFTGATNATDIITVAEDEVFRLYAVESHSIVSGQASVLEALLINLEFPLTNVPVGNPPVLSNTPTLWETSVPIMMPLTRLSVGYTGGIAATQIFFAVYGTRAPLGTVFHV